MVKLYQHGAVITVPDHKAAYLESVGWSRKPPAKAPAPKAAPAPKPEQRKEEDDA